MSCKYPLIIFLLFTFLYSVTKDEAGTDEISYLTDHFNRYPLYINSATAEEIYDLPYIDEITAFRIYESIQQSGRISSVYDLYSQGLISKETADILENCIFTAEDEITGLQNFYNSRYKRTLETSRAYKDSSYLGSPELFSQKFRFRSPKLSFTFLSDKEPGETEYTDNLKANLVYENGEGFRVVLGNYKVKSFTGMLQNEIYFYDPYSSSFGSGRKDIIRPVPSFADYFGYNGTAVDKDFPTGKLSFFYGIKPVSAGLDEAGMIRSVNLYSYTRTVTEIERYHNSDHRLAGGSFQGNITGLDYYVSFSHESFDKGLSPGSELKEGICGEVLFLYGTKGSRIRTDIGSDMRKTNFRTSFRKRSGDLTSDIFYGYSSEDKLSLNSPGMILGKGESEHVFGLKMKSRLMKSFYLISRNLIYFDRFYNRNYPGAEFRLETEIKKWGLNTNCYFRYKYEEFVDDAFISDSSSEYISKIKAQYGTEECVLTTIFRYNDPDPGGFGYMMTQIFDIYAGNFTIRTGTDIYYTEDATVYSALADIGRYPSIASYTGRGSKVFLRLKYKKGPVEVISGISSHNNNDSEQSGSGYDLIDSDTVHKFEIGISLRI